MTFFPRWKEAFNFQPLFVPHSVKRDGKRFWFDLLLMGDELGRLREIVRAGEIPCDIYCDGVEYKVSLFSAGDELQHHRVACHVEVIE